MCILARYGNGGKVTAVPTAASFAVATTEDKTRRSWYGGCAAGDSRACCDNGAVLASGFDWGRFAMGSACEGNADRSRVTVALTCFFDDDIQYAQQPPPEPDPVDFFEIPEVLESDEEPFASRLVNLGGTCQLAIQDTGRLAVTKVAGQDVLWRSGDGPAGGTAPYSLGIFDQGNLVLSDATGKSLWSTATAGSGAIRGILFKDCNFCLVKDFVGKGEWSRGKGQPAIDTAAASCASLPYPSCHANPGCVYVRKWGCFPRSSKTDGTKQWCRELGRPRSQCVKNPKCKYDTTRGCYASYPAISAQRAALPSSLYMMDPARVRPLPPSPPGMSALDASIEPRPAAAAAAARFAGEFRLDPASELQARRRLLGVGGGGGGGDEEESLSQQDIDDGLLLDDGLDDILSDSDADDGAEGGRGRGGGGGGHRRHHQLRVATGVMQLEGGMAPDEWGAIDPVTGAPRLLCGDRVTAPDSERQFKVASPPVGTALL